ncbi:MAG: biotin--[acetyl-CoA-carboxylase] ligase [Candidatus Pacebacteria bacterium]|nr:biotin--[acetyl-CoA-carboxylase] ligase [Candidatus Paceibacterota bacterium]
MLNFNHNLGMNMTLLVPIYYDQLGSSNDQARTLARAGAASGTLVIARTQTQGRGRQGRQWQSPQGNFYGSLIWRSSKPPNQQATIALVTGIAVNDSVVRYLPITSQHYLTLKWPNDLHYNRHKLAGILVETETSPHEPLTAIIIGIGVNLSEAPHDLPYPATSINSIIGTAPTLTEFTEQIGQRLIQRLEKWERHGFAALADDWNLRAAGYQGRAMVAIPPNPAEGGTFHGVGPDGALLLNSNGSLRSHYSGEWRFSDGYQLL